MTAVRTVLSFWPAALLVAFAVLPFVPGKQASLYAQNFVPLFIYAILALGLNVVVGSAGLFHLGIAAFFGIGAYATGILTVPQFPFQWSFAVALLVSIFAAAFAGMAATAPTLRLRGDYLALVTMGFGLIAVFVMRNLENITEGTKGLNPVSPHLLPGMEDPNLAEYKRQPSWGISWRRYPYFYFLCLGMLAAIYLALGMLERSRLGRAWVALREDELAASCMGLNPAKLKLAAIAIGAGIAGLAGSLYAVSQSTTADPNSYNFNRSMIALCCIILGGLGNRPGVLLGTLLLIGFDQVLTPKLDAWVQDPAVINGMPEFLRGKEYTKLSMWKLGIFGLVLIVMMRFRPAGLLPESRHQHELNPGK